MKVESYKVSTGDAGRDELVAEWDKARASRGTKARDRLILHLIATIVDATAREADLMRAIARADAGCAFSGTHRTAVESRATLRAAYFRQPSPEPLDRRLWVGPPTLPEFNQYREASPPSPEEEPIDG